MDISKEYIKMCEKAEEIQKLWKPIAGDWFLHDYRGTTGFSKELESVIWGDNDGKWNHIEILCYQPDDEKNYWVGTDTEKSRILSAECLFKHHTVWLPRQDQLQEMYWEYIVENDPLRGECVQAQKPELLSNNFNKYVMRDGTRPRLESMEQLWLTFVMKEKFGKVWDGEEWVLRKEE